MNDWQLWFLVLIAGVILVIAYTLLVKALIKDPSPCLSDKTWLMLHFGAGLILGVVLPNPTIQMFGFSVVWEVVEKILGVPEPQYFAEPITKAIADVAITTAGYALGQWLQGTKGF